MRFVSLVSMASFAFGVTCASPSAAAPIQESTSPTSGVMADRAEREPRRPVHLGVLAGVGFPRPIAIEGLVIVRSAFGFGFEYGMLPTVRLMDAEARLVSFAATVRYFPFRAPFFVGLRAGHQRLEARADLTHEPLGTFVESRTASTWFVNPRIGLLVRLKSGITLGAEAGIQVPVSSGMARRGPLSDAGLAGSSSFDRVWVTAAELLGSRPTATLDVLRLGYLF